MAAPIPLYDDSKIPRIPWVTWGLIAANVLVFLFLQPRFDQQGFLDGLPAGARAAASTRPLDDFDDSLRVHAGARGAVSCELDELASTRRRRRLRPRERRRDLERGASTRSAPSLPADKMRRVARSFSSMFLHGGILHLWATWRSSGCSAGRSRPGSATCCSCCCTSSPGVAAVATFTLLNPGSAIPLVGCVRRHLRRARGLRRVQPPVPRPDVPAGRLACCRRFSSRR